MQVQCNIFPSYNMVTPGFSSGNTIFRSKQFIVLKERISEQIPIELWDNPKSFIVIPNLSPHAITMIIRVSFENKSSFVDLIDSKTDSGMYHYMCCFPACVDDILMLKIHLPMGMDKTAHFRNQIGIAHSSKWSVLFTTSLALEI